MDPSSRPSPVPQVRKSAETVGAVHVLAADLYRQWTLVAADRLDSETVIESLKTAAPGFWIPPVSQSDTQSILEQAVSHPCNVVTSSSANNLETS